MKKVIRHGLLLFAIIMLGLPSLTHATNSKAIKIGYTAPFTGASAENGINGWRGVQLALEEINKEGITVNGESHIRKF